MVKTYKKKPTEIEAIEWLGYNFIEVSEFITTPHEVYSNRGEILIGTPRGEMKAVLGNFIIKDVDGKFYPKTAEEFHKMYEV